MYLFFDTETTGLPDNWNAPASDTRNWPRMVQLAFLLYQPDGTLVESGNHIIKPDGYTIPLDASKIHGITTERANREGVALSNVLSNFQTMTAKATALIAHNMEFDEKILGCEFYRSTGRDPLTAKQKFCTMKSPSVINYCALPPIRYGSYKWPKLSELHYKLFQTGFDEAHNAAVDITVTAKCFWELKRIGKNLKIKLIFNGRRNKWKANFLSELNPNQPTYRRQAYLELFLLKEIYSQQRGDGIFIWACPQAKPACRRQAQGVGLSASIFARRKGFPLQSLTQTARNILRFLLLIYRSSGAKKFPPFPI